MELVADVLHVVGRLFSHVAEAFLDFFHGATALSATVSLNKTYRAWCLMKNLFVSVVQLRRV